LPFSVALFRWADLAGEREPAEVLEVPAELQRLGPSPPGPCSKMRAWVASGTPVIIAVMHIWGPCPLLASDAIELEPLGGSSRWYVTWDIRLGLSG
jgi:hypothetical protein